MRTNYPIFSKELNDIFQELYYKLNYLLGYVNESYEKTYTGVYDTLETKVRTLTNNNILTLNDSETELEVYSESVYSYIGKLIVINELRSL